MSRFTLLTPETAPPETTAWLNTARKNSGYLPNLLGVLANAPTALETYLTVSGINARSGLSPAEREVVQIAAAALHGCTFCVAGHTAIAEKKISMEPHLVEALRAQQPLDDARLNALREFTLLIIEGRGQVEDRALNEFLSAGFTQANALEVVLGVSLATLCNFANNLAQTPLNPELAPYRWDRS